VGLHLHSPNTSSWRGAELSTRTTVISITSRFHRFMYCFAYRDSSVDIALGYGLDDWGSRVRFPVGAGNFSLRHRVQNGCGAHPASCPMGTKYPFPGGKAAGA
jgi:hypothetical protein